MIIVELIALVVNLILVERVARLGAFSPVSSASISFSPVDTFSVTIDK